MAEANPSMTPQQLVSAVRGKEPMTGLCASRQITEEGCDWMKFALDPFHDLQLDNLRGYPDVNTEPTVIVKIRQAIEISAPVGLNSGQGPDKNWDCHICLSPIDWAKPTGLLRSSSPIGGERGYNAAAHVLPQGGPALGASLPAGAVPTIGGSSTYGAVTGRLDGLLINSVPAISSDGADWTFTPGHCPNQATLGYALDQINLDNYLDFDDTDLGVYRVVYSGFEVVNTTAQIYKQGAVTVYEYGHSYENAQATFPFTGVTGSEPTPMSIATNQFRSPPNTIAEAKIMPGAHTWPAQDGAYCTAKFLGDNPFQAVTNRNYSIQQNKPTGFPIGPEAPRGSGYLTDGAGVHNVGSFVSPGYLGPIQNINISGNSSPIYQNSGMSCAPAVHFSRMSTAGAYFTGLSPQTTLFVTWRVGLERLPAANKPTFLALAQPSATFDPNALLLYNLIANHLPPGCPQGWNDLGKWYNTIATVARRVIPAAFPMVSTAQMILNGLGAVQQAKALPAVVKGAQDAYNIARAAISNPRQVQAARTIQAAARRKTQPKKLAVQNFGQPAYNGRRSRAGNRVQRFSQMS